jgi:hypothetical protein
MSLLDDFKAYIAETKMTFSYKPVLTKTLLDHVDTSGGISRAALIRHFRQFYINRQQNGLAPEKSRSRYPSPMLTPEVASDDTVWQIIARYPLPLMSDYLDIDDEHIAIKPEIWNGLSAAELVNLRQLAQQRVERYYADF